MSHKIGWIIGIGIVGVVAAIITSQVVFPSASPPSATTAAGYLQQQDVPYGLDVVLGSTPAEAGNAADDYQKALEVYRANAEGIRRAVQNDDLPGVQVRQAIEKIDEHAAAAARKPFMLYTTVYALKDMEVRYHYREDDPADAFAGMGEALNLLARQQRKKGDAEQAEKTYRNAFMVGWHMMAERARPYMVLLGMDLQLKALMGMEEMYKSAGRDDREKAVRDYANALDRVANTYQGKMPVFRTIKPNAGDLINVVKNAKDRSLRTQCLLLLGLVKFTAQTRGDLRQAKSVMNDYAGNSDPVLAAAAKAAQKFAREDFNFFGSRY